MYSAVQLRLAQESDLPEINAIYNHYVRHSTCTYQEDDETLDSRLQWFARHRPTHPIIVAQRDQTILGWGSLSPFHPRSAFRFTVENSVYVHHQHQRRGIGSLILRDLVDRARALRYHSVIASIDGHQIASIQLHARFGFQEIARFQEVGYKFDQWLDVVYLQLMLQTTESQQPMLFE